MGRRYANFLERAGNTPVVKINKLAPPHLNLFVKMEAFNPLGTVKGRLALSVIEKAERTGRRKAGQTVIEAASCNTAGHGLRAERLCPCRHHGGVIQRRTAQTHALPRRKGRAHTSVGKGYPRGSVSIWESGSGAV